MTIEVAPVFSASANTALGWTVVVVSVPSETRTGAASVRRSAVLHALDSKHDQNRIRPRACEGGGQH